MKKCFKCGKGIPLFCWECLKAERFVMTAFTLLLLTSFSFALSWETFVKMPIEEKMILQYEGLKKIANGTMSNQYLSRSEALQPLQAFSSMIAGYSAYDPIGYKRAVANVKEFMKNMTFTVAKTEPAKMIKVGDHKYVSESICKANPKECEPQDQPAKPVAQKPVVQNKRTPEQCLSARQKDWDAYVYSNYPNVPTEGVNAKEKAALLDRMAEGYYSWQAKCLRGE